MDALWLRVSGFGASQSSSRALLRYIEFARSTHGLGVPVVAERTGTLGLALLAFGAVGGIEQGVTFGERFDVKPLLREPSGSAGFMPAPRVYLAEIGAFIKQNEAEQLFTDRSAKNRFGCQRPCCKRGIHDMLRDPRRHFLVCRSDEIAELSRVPVQVRPDQYLDTWLRPASDRVGVAARVLPRLSKHCKRLDEWRTALSDQRMIDKRDEPSIAHIPTGRRIQQWGA